MYLYTSGQLVLEYFDTEKTLKNVTILRQITPSFSNFLVNL